MSLKVNINKLKITVPDKEDRYGRTKVRKKFGIWRGIMLLGCY